MPSHVLVPMLSPKSRRRRLPGGRSYCLALRKEYLEEEEASAEPWEGGESGRDYLEEEEVFFELLLH